MCDIKNISPYYIPIYEAFCSFPVPDDPFSLLSPMEGDEKCDDSLDILDEIDDLTELGDFVLELIDADINEERAPCPPDAFPGVEHSFLPFPMDPSELTDSIPPNTADNKQPLPIPHSVGAFAPTKLPAWLVRPEAFDDTAHYVCTIEVQDLSAKRLKLLCMHVADKVIGGPNANIIKNSKKVVDSVSKSLKENTIASVPQAVQPKAKEPSAMKMSGEERSSINPTASVTLVNEKLWNHFHKLSKINVPVLGSSFQRGTNAPLRSRRKQVLLPQINALESKAVKLETASNERSTGMAIPIVPNETSKQVTNHEEVSAEQPSAVSIGNISDESDRVLKNKLNIRSCTKKMAHKFNGKQKTSDKASLDRKSRKLFKNGKPGSSPHRERRN